MSRRTVPLLVALSATMSVLPAGPAAAGAPWLSPATLAHDGGTRPQVSMTDAGQGLAVWSDPSFNGVFVSEQPPGASFGPPRRFSDDPHPILSAALGENGDAVLAWTHSGSGQLKVSIRAGGTNFDAPAVLSDPAWQVQANGESVDVAINRNGTAVVAWLEADGSVWDGAERQFRVRAAWRLPGGHFGPAQTISYHRFGAGDVGVTLDDGGLATLLWMAAEPDARMTPSEETSPCGPARCGRPPVRVRASTGTVGGWVEPVGVSAHVGHVRGNGRMLTVAGNPRGDVVAAWAQDGGNHPDVDTGAFASTMSRGHDWSPPQYLRPGPGAIAADLDAAVDPHGNAVVGWEAECSTAFVYRRAGEAFGKAFDDCALYERGVPAVGFDGRGRAVVVYGLERGDYRRAPLHTVRYTPGKGVGPVTDISGDVGGRNIGAAVAFDALGHGVVLWEGDAGDQPGASYDGKRGIRMARYDATPPAVERLKVTGRTKRPAFRYRLSEPARVSVKLERRTRCRRGRRSCFKRVTALSGRGRAGDNTLKVPARRRRALAQRGTYRARLMAWDRAGNRARPRTVKFRRLRR